MSEIVERVARAAYIEFSGYDPNSEFAWWIGKDQGTPYDWRLEAERTSIGSKGFLACARAAIVAMREPTTAMESAAEQFVTNDESARVSAGASEVWQIMLDEALK